MQPTFNMIKPILYFIWRSIIIVSVIGCLSPGHILTCGLTCWVLSPQTVPNFSCYRPFSEHDIDRKLIKPNTVPKGK